MSPKQSLRAKFSFMAVTRYSPDLAKIKMQRVASSDIPVHEKAIKIANIVVDNAKNLQNYIRGVNFFREIGGQDVQDSEENK